MTVRAVLLLLLLLAAGPAAAQPSSPAAPLCRRVSADGQGYAICTVDLRRHRLDLFWRRPDGTPYAGFDRLLSGEAGRGLVAAMNAGMYEEDLGPVGLYVEKGRELKPANTRDGPGNFHLKPNGVFFVADGRAGLLETRVFLRRRPRAAIATQSGPMLVVGGRIHPRISDDGPSRKLRNGVGVRDAHTVVLAISDGPVSFGAFARLFRDTLGCPDALFLDGSVSGLYAADLGRRDILFKPIGPILGVSRR